MCASLDLLSLKIFLPNPSIALHKDDTLFQSGRPTGLNIYFVFHTFTFFVVTIQYLLFQQHGWPVFIVPSCSTPTDPRDSPWNRRDSRTTVSGYLVNEASEDEDILQVARYMLEFAMDKPDVLEHPVAALSAFLQDQLTRRENA